MESSAKVVCGVFSNVQMFPRQTNSTETALGGGGGFSMLVPLLVLAMLSGGGGDWRYIFDSTLASMPSLMPQL